MEFFTFCRPFCYFFQIMEQLFHKNNPYQFEFEDNNNLFLITLYFVARGQQAHWELDPF